MSSIRIFSEPAKQRIFVKWISSNVRLARLFLSVLISFNLYGVHEECISSYNSERNSKVFRRVHYISVINMPISIRKK